jgi:hypothetical protein
VNEGKRFSEEMNPAKGKAPRMKKRNTEYTEKTRRYTERFNIFSVSLRVTLFSKEPKADS